MERDVLAALERDHAIRVKPEWLSQCLAFLRTKAPGSMRIATLVTFVVEQFLVADLRAIGAPAIPGNAALLATLPGPLVLQINEIVNISEPLERRYEEVGPGRTRVLKMALTDGHRTIVGLESDRIDSLRVLTHPGCKIRVRNVQLRRGTLLLSKTNVEVLGGHVKELVDMAVEVRKAAKRSELPQEWMEELRESLVAHEAPAPQPSVMLSSPAPTPSAVSNFVSTFNRPAPPTSISVASSATLSYSSSTPQREPRMSSMLPPPARSVTQQYLNRSHATPPPTATPSRPPASVELTASLQQSRTVPAMDEWYSEDAQAEIESLLAFDTSSLSQSLEKTATPVTVNASASLATLFPQPSSNVSTSVPLAPLRRPTFHQLNNAPVTCTSDNKADDLEFFDYAEEEELLRMFEVTTKPAHHLQPPQVPSASSNFTPREVQHSPNVAPAVEQAFTPLRSTPRTATPLPATTSTSVLSRIRRTPNVNAARTTVPLSSSLRPASPRSDPESEPEEDVEQRGQKRKAEPLNLLAKRPRTETFPPPARGQSTIDSYIVLDDDGIPSLNTTPPKTLIPRNSVDLTTPEAPPSALSRSSNSLDFTPTTLLFDNASLEPPLVYIGDLTRAKPDSVRIKGYLVEIVKDSFGVSLAGFRVKVTIADGSGEAAVNLDHAVLKPLISVSPDAFMRMQVTPNGINALRSITAAMPKRLQRLRGVFYVDQWNTSEPVVTKVVSDIGHAQELGWEFASRLVEE